MKCHDLEELLSAYADGELSRTQREFIEEHLSGCAGCRETLAQFEAVGRRLSSLRETPAVPDISKNTLAKIKAAGINTPKDRWRWLRPVTTAAAIVAVIAIMLAAQPWSMESSEAMAASIVRNSPAVQAALNGEEIEEVEEVEVTTKVVDEENNVIMMLVKTEARVVTAEVNLETKKVTEIVRVDMPNFQPGDEQRGIDIAKTDPRVQDLLAQGGVISEAHLSHSLGKTVDGEWEATPTVFLSIKPADNTNVRWNVVVDLTAETVRSIGESQPSSAMIIVNISRFVSNFVAPVLLILSILLILGLSYNHRTSKKVAGIAALVLGTVGLFMALYSLSSIWWRQILSIGIPVVGLIIGVTGIRHGLGKRWLTITGVVFSALALLLVFFNEIMVSRSSMPEDNNIAAVIGMAVVIAGIMAYAFKEQIMTLNVSGRWLRPAVIALAAIIVLIVVLVQPWSVNPEGVIAKAYSATESLLSYRASISGTASEGGNLDSIIEFVFPDRFHAIITSGGETDEFIVVGDKQYVKSGDMSRNMIIAFSNSATSMLSKEATLRILDSLTDLQRLPDETIEGVSSFHYKGRFNTEKMIEKEKVRLAGMQSRMEPDDYQEMMKGLENSLNVKTEVELWIGKGDSLIRRIMQVAQAPDSEGQLHTSSMTFRYYDFNQPITIEPPMDTNGQLLDGWQLAGSITPDSKQPVFGRNITSSIGAQEGYTDWAHQEVKYSITITNNSIETVKNVRISIATMLTDESSKPARVEATPETPADIIAPGESRTFHARCPFDATNYTKEEIVKLHDMATILVHFTTEDGRELTQLIYPDAPYPTKTPPSN
jgi:hypothetical protein